MQRRQGEARGTRCIGAVCDRSGFLRVDLGEGVQLAVGLFDTRQQRVDNLARGEALGGKAGREFGQGEFMQRHQ